MRLTGLTIILCVMAFLTYAQQKPLPLYPDGIPNSKPTPAGYVEKTQNDWITNVSIPTLTPYLPANGTANGTAVVVCPGGGYAGLAAGHEGKAIAEELAKNGVAAFVLKYRLPSDLIMVDKSIGPLQDAQRAIQMVREHAAEWKIDPKRVGIIGFSAGGHLASTAATHFNKVLIDNKNNISVRPDFGIFIYPVITFGQYTHQGSKENLTGKNATQEIIDLYSNEKQVTAQTPPVFLVHAQDDTVVPVQNSLQLYSALLQAGVKTEMHLYPAGGHGFGMINPTTKELWFSSLMNWMRSNGWVK